jgi:hypothetical protein
MIANYVSAPTGNDKEIPYSRFITQSCDNVFENRLSFHEDHGLGQIRGEFAHARPLPRGKNYGFHVHPSLPFKTSRKACKSAIELKPEQERL